MALAADPAAGLPRDVKERVNVLIRDGKASQAAGATEAALAAFSAALALVPTHPQLQAKVRFLEDQLARQACEAAVAGTQSGPAFPTGWPDNTSDARFAPPPPASEAPPVPLPEPAGLDAYGWDIDPSAAEATLPGGYRLPLPLYRTLFPHQRAGVAWLWSLHPGLDPSTAAVVRRRCGLPGAPPADAPPPRAPLTLHAATGSTSAGCYLHPGGILSDDMGLGKTLQTIAYIVGLFNSELGSSQGDDDVAGVRRPPRSVWGWAGPSSTVLVVAPVSLLPVWEAEFAKFAPRLRVRVYHPGGAGEAGKAGGLTDAACERNLERVLSGGGVLLTTYGLLSTRAERLGGVRPVVRGARARRGGGKGGGGSGRAAPSSSSSSSRLHMSDDEDDNERDDKASDDEDNDDSSGSDDDNTAGAAAASGGGGKAATPRRRRRRHWRHAPPGCHLPAASSVAAAVPPWDLVVLDEGHHIKNRTTASAHAAAAIPAWQRLLLTGTPLQNNLAEFWTLLDFATFGGCMGSQRAFKQEIAEPVARGRDRRAGPEDVAAAAAAAARLAVVTGAHILRREKAELLAAGGLNKEGNSSGDSVPAPPPLGVKLETAVWCRPSSAQTALYSSFLATREVAALLAPAHGPGAAASTQPSPLAAISLLERLASCPLVLPRPKLAGLLAGYFGTSASAAEPSLAALLDQGNNDGKEADGGWDAAALARLRPGLLLALSCKARAFVALMRRVVSEGSRALVFSPSRRALDVLGLLLSSLWSAEEDHAALLAETSGGAPEAVLAAVAQGLASSSSSSLSHWQAPAGGGVPFLRIDGTQTAGARAAAVTRFNADASIPACLLTTGVGALGLTLTGADRVILFDTSWNPAVDAQAVDRAYRVGQTRPVVVYRLLTCGTISEKMYRLAVYKAGLSKAVLPPSSPPPVGMNRAAPAAAAPRWLTAARSPDAPNNNNSGGGVARYLTRDEIRNMFTLGDTAYPETRALFEEAAAACGEGEGGTTSALPLGVAPAAAFLDDAAAREEGAIVAWTDHSALYRVSEAVGGRGFGLGARAAGARQQRRSSSSGGGSGGTEATHSCPSIQKVAVPRLPPAAAAPASSSCSDDDDSASVIVADDDDDDGFAAASAANNHATASGNEEDDDDDVVVVLDGADAYGSSQWLGPAYDDDGPSFAEGSGVCEEAAWEPPSPPRSTKRMSLAQRLSLGAGVPAGFTYDEGEAEAQAADNAVSSVAAAAAATASASADGEAEEATAARELVLVEVAQALDAVEAAGTLDPTSELALLRAAAALGWLRP